ncbi:MAG: sulfatase family protein [Planctomycetota bacterium]
MPERPRHIIWITTDHMRYDCVGANGNEAVRTPNLDRLAVGGVVLERCYGQSPLCMPSRASFMTGQYPCRTGVLCNGPALPPERGPTCATIFARAGYAAAQVGKLHLQPHDEMDLDPRPRRDYGFGYVALAEEPGCYDDAYTRWLRTEHPAHAEAMRVSRPSERVRTGDDFSWWTVDAPAEASHAGFAVEEAIHFLELGLPSFIHVGIYAPHPPLNPPEAIYAGYRGADVPEAHWREGEKEDKPLPLRAMLAAHQHFDPEHWRERRRFFYAMCTLLDSQVGRLLEALEARGELDQTLILFMSDHGDMDGDHRMVSKDASFYEEVMRLPAVLYWPEGLPAGRRLGQLVEAVDLLPTLCELCGLSVPPSVQGRSFAAWATGQQEGEFRRDVLAMHGEPGSAVWAMLRSAELKYIRYGPKAEVLYDLAEDSGEYANRAGDEAYGERLGQMRETLLQRMLEAATSGLPHHHPF